MADKQILAALLTIALTPAKSGGSSNKGSTAQVGNLLMYYKMFLKALDRADQSIDRRGINPD